MKYDRFRQLDTRPTPLSSVPGSGDSRLNSASGLTASVTFQYYLWLQSTGVGKRSSDVFVLLSCGAESSLFSSLHRRMLLFLSNLFFGDCVCTGWPCLKTSFKGLHPQPGTVVRHTLSDISIRQCLVSGRNPTCPVLIGHKTLSNGKVKVYLLP